MKKAVLLSLPLGDLKAFINRSFPTSLRSKIQRRKHALELLGKAAFAEKSGDF
jgi:hypothetical protein